jgi:hypothetical protein
MTLTQTDAEQELPPADRAALERAIELYRTGSPTQRKTIDVMFARGDGWEYVARYAAFHMQVANLHLPPWQPAPCDIGPRNMASALAETDEQRGYRAAALLRQRMERCGVSQWHPDPARECDRIEAEQRQTAK